MFGPCIVFRTQLFVLTLQAFYWVRIKTAWKLCSTHILGSRLIYINAFKRPYPWHVMGKFNFEGRGNRYLLQSSILERRVELYYFRSFSFLFNRIFSLQVLLGRLEQAKNKQAFFFNYYIGLVVRIQHSHCCGLGSIPDQGINAVIKNKNKTVCERKIL